MTKPNARQNSTERKIAKWFCRFVMAAFFLVQNLAAPTAHARATCEGLFQPSLQSSLPAEFSGLLENLPARTLRKFEVRFAKRSRIKAEREAEQLVALLLKDNGPTAIALRPLFNQETRRHMFTRVLTARLDTVTAEVTLEKVLIEIGYRETSDRSQRWRDFRERHFRVLNTMKRTAVNIATSLAIGVPLYVKPLQYASFYASKSDKAQWNKVEAEIRDRIETGDRKLIRNMKIEAALKVAAYIMAAVVIALLADETLDFITPKWGLLKGQVGGALTMESREELEVTALEDWKDVMESFTEMRPADDAPETIEMRARIKAASKEELWIHVHQKGPLPE